MLNESNDPELSPLLEEYEAAGGVLDFVFMELENIESSDAIHRLAALRGIETIADRLGRWFESQEIRNPFRLTWDAEKLAGKEIAFDEFWGTDDVEPKRLGGTSSSIPIVDGYKTAFFHPPYSMRGDIKELFAKINNHILRGGGSNIEVYSWSTDWSNYFDAGHEWWGAFLWTIRQRDSSRVTVIAASSTD